MKRREAIATNDDDDLAALLLPLPFSFLFSTPPLSLRTQ